ncbi:phage major capsid protein [Methanoculleus sp.]|uniref:phage major capsid protein n=1 Tax=Methanoculleus sp. TaxID=90427 RepID=UPI00272DFFDE|nr:phage major capsid protein [Methanoculleus sp.]
MNTLNYDPTRLLETYFEMWDKGMGRQKELAENPTLVPRALTTNHEGKVQSVRKLLLSTEIEGTALVPTTFYNTVIKGARAVCAVRGDIVPWYKMTGKTLRVPKGETGDKAPRVNEGAPFSRRTQNYDYMDFAAEKYGECPTITAEMIADSQYDVMAREVENTGYRLENRLNYEVLKLYLETMKTSALEHDTAGTNQGLDAFAMALGKLKEAGWEPVGAILHPEAEAKVLQDFIPPSYYMGQQIALQGFQPKQLLGVNVGVTGVAGGPDTSIGESSAWTYTWGYAADGEIGALLIGSGAGGVGMRQDITIENWKDNLHQLDSANVFMRFGCSAGTETAVVRVEF